MHNKKIAVILFNLGGPDKIESVKPFLFNLFYDKYIITLPTFLRYIFAKLISIKREKIAQNIYSTIGGKSPIVEETMAQKEALDKKLYEISKDGQTIKTFIVMRHWHPFAEETLKYLKAYSPNEIILLPLYPQFSTTTSLSSIENFKEEMNKTSIKYDSLKSVCCYPTQDKFIAAHVDLIEKEMLNLQNLTGSKNPEEYRILFSAHGLPQKIIDSGDPYQWQIEKTVEKIVKNLNVESLDHKITYQSRVGPLKWIGPNTEEEIHISGKEKKNLIIVPVAFVSEHVETLVELDVEYKHIADNYGIKYLRVPTVRVNKYFIDSLFEIIENFVNNDDKMLVSSCEMKRLCPENFKQCICNKNV